MPWIETYSGIEVDLANPKPEMISVVDIAWSLARQNRYLGHTRFSLSVAQHSVMVSEAAGLSLSERRWGLAHDFHEAYLGDLSRPLVEALGLAHREFPGILAAMKAKFDHVICAKLGLAVSQADRDKIALVDTAALKVEALHLMESRGRSWSFPPDADGIPIRWRGDIWRPDQATERLYRQMGLLGII